MLGHTVADIGFRFCHVFKQNKNDSKAVVDIDVVVCACVPACVRVRLCVCVLKKFQDLRRKNDEMKAIHVSRKRKRKRKKGLSFL